MEIIKILLIASLFSLITGQLLRFSLFLNYGALNLTDLLVFALDLTFIFYVFFNRKKTKFSRKVFPVIILFTLWAATANIFSLSFLNFSEVASSPFFLLRFLAYFFISQVVLNSLEKEKIISWLNTFLLIGFIFIACGFLQLILFPNLNFLTVYGWDPHQKRIVSTILDPNFAGLIFVFIFSTAISLYLFEQKSMPITLTSKNRLLYLGLSLLAIVAVLLTYSRSSYLALIAAGLTIGTFKSPKILLAVLIFLLVSFIAIPQVKNRIIGAFEIDETSQARIVSWKNAITIFQHQPIFGVGFNNYRYAQAKYRLFAYPEQIELHSASGVDSSLLLVAATTGIIGLLLFLALIAVVISSAISNIYLQPASLISLTVFLSLLVHSQFVNSFFFPQISLIFWFIFGLSQINDN